MALDPDLAGRTFPATAPYEVTDGRIAAFAAATGTPYDGSGPAPATFPIVVAFAAMRQLLDEPGVGIALHRVVHGQQGFVHARPVRPGDLLTATLTVTGVRAAAGTDLITTSTAIADEAGEPVCTAEATLVHRAEG